MTTYAELISTYPQIDPVAKFGLRPRPTSATKEMVETAEKVVAALVTADNFDDGFGCERARDALVLESNKILNIFVDQYQNGNNKDHKYTLVNCKNLAKFTNVPTKLIEQYAKYSGFNIIWGSHREVNSLKACL